MTTPTNSTTAPVFRSEKLDNSPNALALWGRHETKGPHVTGTLTQVDGNGQQFSTKVSGFFKISDRGDVQIPLSTNVNNQYVTVGVLYIQKTGDLKFYPKDKNQPQLVVKATNVMTAEVAEAIGVKRPEYKRTYETPSASPAQESQPPAEHSQNTINRPRF